MKVRNYQELLAWQRAMDLVEEVYEATRGFPHEEIYGLRGQIGRLLNGLDLMAAELVFD